MLRLAWGSLMRAPAVAPASTMRNNLLSLPIRNSSDEAGSAGSSQSSPLPSKLTFSLLAPHHVIFTKKEVDMVIVPGASGMFGILPGHVPTISELKPGVIEVTTSPGDVAKYFVSSGFAFVHANSTLDVCAIEAVSLDDLDQSAVLSGKSDAEAELSRATDEVEKAKAQLALDVYTAMAEALAGK
jgi:F-type H+-transporting ATPase subunit delta